MRGAMTDPKALDFSETLENGKPRYKLMRNGSIRDQGMRRIVKGATLSSDQARELALIKQQKHQAAMTEGLAEGMKVTTGDKDAGVVKKIGEKAGELMSKTTNSRGFAELARFAVEKSGLLPRENDTPAPVQTINNNLFAVTPDQAEQVCRLLEAAQARRAIVEGEVTEQKPPEAT